MKLSLRFFFPALFVPFAAVLFFLTAGAPLAHAASTESNSSWCNSTAGPANVCPQLNAQMDSSSTASGTLYVVQGAYMGGMNTNMAACSIDNTIIYVPIPYGGPTASFTWETDDGLSGKVLNAPYQQGGGGNCVAVTAGTDLNGLWAVAPQVDTLTTNAENPGLQDAPVNIMLATVLNDIGFSVKTLMDELGLSDMNQFTDLADTYGLIERALGILEQNGFWPTLPGNYSGGFPPQPEVGTYMFGFYDNQPGAHVLTIKYQSQVFPQEVKLNIPYGVGKNYKGKRAAYVSDNIPRTFQPQQKVATGTDGLPVNIVVKNTGSAPWVSNGATPIKISGSCDTNIGSSRCPTPTSTSGTTCTITMANSSDEDLLGHVSGSFTASRDPARFQQITTNTCKLVSTLKNGCSNTAPECASSAACVSAGTCYDSNGGTLSCSDSSSCLTPTKFTGCGGVKWVPGCAGVWYNNDVHYSQTVVGSPDVAPGATTTFFLGSVSAPATPGYSTETWMMPYPDPMPILLQVVGSSTVSGNATGTITVQSESALQSSIAVSTTWDLNGPVHGSSIDTDQCDYPGITCSGSSQMYSGMPLGNYTIITPKSVFGAQGEWVLDSTSPCGFNGNEVNPCPSKSYLNTPSLTISSSSATTQQGNFILLWDPVAALGVTPTSLSFTSASTSAIVTIQNVGAPGSTLNWNESTTYSSGASGWLSLSARNGGIANSSSQWVSGGATQPLTVTASPSGLKDGTYSAVLDFSGTGQYCTGANGSCGADQKVTVTLTIGGGCGTGCGGSTSITITPANDSITLGKTETYTIKSNNLTTCTGSSSWSGSKPCNGTVNTTPSAVGTYTYVVMGSGPAGSANATATLVVTSGGGGCGQGNCSCQVSASPSSITVPQYTTLNYVCGGSNCSLSGGSFTNSAVTQAKGSTQDNPAVSTVYTLTCPGGGGGGGSVASTTVIVTNQNRKETTP